MNNEKPLAFLIGRFDHRLRFLHEALQRVVAQCHSAGQCPIPGLSELDDTTSDRLLAALDRFLDHTCLVIADITPERTEEYVSWNPNVLYELGRVHQARIPVFAVCDEACMPSSGVQLPFDIHDIPVHPYKFTPDGLARLGKEFSEWIEKKNVASFERSLTFLNMARDVRNRIVEWDPARHAHFHGLLKEQFRRLQRHVYGMDEWIRGDRLFQFRPPSRAEVVEDFFIETLDAMRDGDAYQTVSTLAFCNALPEHDRFLASCIAAVRRRVKMERVIVIPPRSKLTAADSLILSQHEHSGSGELGVGVRFVVRDETDPNKHKDHSGICSWKLGQVTVFKPHYDLDPASGRARLIGIDYLEDAVTYAGYFAQTWDSALPTVEQALDAAGRPLS